MTVGANSSVTVIACLEIEWWGVKHDIISISYQLSLYKVAKVI